MKLNKTKLHFAATFCLIVSVITSFGDMHQVGPAIATACFLIPAITLFAIIFAIE